MDGHQRLGDLLPVTRDPGRLRPVFINDDIEAAALDVLHDQERSPFVLDHVEHRGHVRVNHSRRVGRLLRESLEQVGIRGRMARHGLDGHVAVETGVMGAVNLTHSAAADGLEEMVPAQDLARSQTHRISACGHGLPNIDRLQGA